MNLVPELPAARSLIDELAPEMTALLRRCIGFPSLSGEEAPVTRFLAGWAKDAGFEVDLWESTEADVAAFGPLPARHLPLAGRPTAVLSVPGTGGGRSLMFNAHTDVVPAGDSSQWTVDPWAGVVRDGKLFGRGACDTKGPMLSAIWAMLVLKRLRPAGLPGPVRLELIPGEEDCVGLGTLTSLARGHETDAAVVLEPTEGQPRNASRGGLRFEITTRGKAVHGTVKWLGTDAIALMTKVLSTLALLESRWNDRAADTLFDPYPIARPITVDTVRGGRWQGMVCDRCDCGGYLELLPGDDLSTWRRRMDEELRAGLHAAGADPACVELTTGEEYTGHRTPGDSPLCAAAERATRAAGPASDWAGWSAFNSGCEAGLRFSQRATPTLVWGPGSLAQAHAADEYVDLAQVRQTALSFVLFALDWCGSR